MCAFRQRYAAQDRWSGQLKAPSLARQVFEVSDRDTLSKKARWSPISRNISAGMVSRVGIFVDFCLGSRYFVLGGDCVKDFGASRCSV